MGLVAPKARKHLSADALLGSVRTVFSQLTDHRTGDPEIPLVDALMSGFAMFSLKVPCLRAFDKERTEDNLQRGKALEEMVFVHGHYLLALNGTGYFSSKKVHCDSCLEKNQRNGTVTYAHQLLGAALIHPDKREVIPLTPEPIIKQDGTTKNDCERNAAKRFNTKLRQDHPHLKLIVTEDSLSSNAPHIQTLQDHT